MKRSKRWLLKRVKVVQAHIVRLKSYTEDNFTDGKYAKCLGSRPTTPCVESDSVNPAHHKLTRINGVDKPKDAVVCHRCDNGKCVLEEHLFWGTKLDNARDCRIKRRHPRWKRASGFDAVEVEVREHSAMLLRYYDQLLKHGVVVDLSTTLAALADMNYHQMLPQRSIPVYPGSNQGSLGG